MGTQTFNPEEQYRRVAQEWFRNRASDRIHVPRDWADDLIKDAARWVYENEIPLWLRQKIENVPNVFLQLPAPDHRWILKFRGELWGPFDMHYGGWQDAHDLISVRTRTLFGIDLEKTGILGDATLSGSGNSCADSYQEAVRKRIHRWLKMVSREMGRKTGLLFRRLFSVENGRYTFSDSVWMTEIGDIPYDASMRLDRGRWIFEVPFSNHELVVQEDQNLRYLARILMCGNLPVPSALLEDGVLLRDFQGRPPYREYFRRTFRKHRIYAGTDDGGETAQQICRVMGLKAGQSFTAYDEIALDSPLHLICGVPVGPVTMLPNGIRGVEAVLAKQRFRLDTISPQFKAIEQHLRMGLQWVLRYPHILQQIESESTRARPVISMGIRRLREKLMQMPRHWTTPYDELATLYQREYPSWQVVPLLRKCPLEGGGCSATTGPAGAGNRSHGIQEADRIQGKDAGAQSDGLRFRSSETETSNMGEYEVERFSGGGDCEASESDELDSAKCARGKERNIGITRF